MKFVSDEWETAVMPTDGNNSFRIMEKKCPVICCMTVTLGTVTVSEPSSPSSDAADVPLPRCVQCGEWRRRHGPDPRRAPPRGKSRLHRVH